MSNKKRIYEYDRLYSVLRYYTDWTFKTSFKKVEYLGVDGIPKDGAVIFAPNHCDALYDPYAVLTMNHERKVFVARADIFKKGFLKKILTFLKIMPIHRQRDGIRNVKQSEETIEKSIEVLDNGVKFCIMPEGTHRSKHSLLPIGKGVARVAYGAFKKLASDTKVYIVPVTVEYGDYFRFRSTLLTQVGKAIDVTTFIHEHPELSEHELMESIRRMVSESLRENIVYIKDDENYEAIWESAKIYSGDRTSEYDLVGRLKSNREAVAKMEQLDEETAKALFAEAVQFKEARTEAKISIKSFAKNRPLWRAISGTLMVLVNLIPFVICAIASLPVWVLNEIAASKLKDKAFHNSFRMGIATLGWIILFIVWVIVLFCNFKWYIALLLALVFVRAPWYVYDYFETFRMFASNWRALCNRKVRRMYLSLREKINTL